SRRLSRITVLTARRLARGFQISWWGSFQPSPTPKDRGLLCNFSSACYFRALSTLTISIPSRRCSPGKLKRDADIRHCLSSKSVLTPLWKHHSVKSNLPRLINYAQKYWRTVVSSLSSHRVCTRSLCRPAVERHSPR